MEGQSRGFFQQANKHDFDLECILRNAGSLINVFKVVAAFAGSPAFAEVTEKSINEGAIWDF